MTTKTLNQYKQELAKEKNFEMDFLKAQKVKNEIREVKRKIRKLKRKNRYNNYNGIIQTSKDSGKALIGLLIGMTILLYTIIKVLVIRLDKMNNRLPQK